MKFWKRRRISAKRWQEKMKYNNGLDMKTIHTIECHFSNFQLFIYIRPEKVHDQSQILFSFGHKLGVVANTRKGFVV